MPGKYILILLLLQLLFGCDYIKRKKGPAEQSSAQERPIARVFDSYLYPIDLAGIVPRNTSPEDSALLIDRYIDSWVRRKLMISQAEQSVQIDLEAIERKMQEYKFDLIAHELRRKEIDKKLKTDVSEEEIVAYYNANKKNYELKTNIVRGYLVKAPLEAPKIKRIEEWMNDERGKYRDDLLEFCQSYAASCFLDDSLWVDFDEIIANTPFRGIENKIQFLKRTKLAKDVDTDFIYFLKIKEYKISDEIAPLEFARDQIVKVILNKRKMNIVRELESRIYNNAKDRGDFEIYKAG